jgi:hypothetical protein
MPELLLERIGLAAALCGAGIGLAWGVTLAGRNWIQARVSKRAFGQASERGQPTLLCFWSEGCTQCKIQEEQVDEVRILLERSGRSIAVRKLNALAERDLAGPMKIMTVPTTVLLDADGRVVAWNPGLTRSRTLLEQYTRLPDVNVAPSRR